MSANAGRRPAAAEPAMPAAVPDGSAGVTEEQVREKLRTCYDPEIPKVNIVDLGLVYDLQILLCARRR